MVGESRSQLYFRERYDMLYYQYVFYMVRVVGATSTSVLDVGSNRCDYLNWLWWIEKKTSLDLNTPYRGKGITSFKEDFLTWNPDQYYDLVLCLQTLEHIPDAESFARKLLQVGRHVIVSVPHNWPEGATISHIHDPVDEPKLVRWMGRKPNYSVVVEEPFPGNNGKGARLVAYFDSEKPDRRVGRKDRLERRPPTRPDEL